MLALIPLSGRTLRALQSPPLQQAESLAHDSPGPALANHMSYLEPIRELNELFHLIVDLALGHAAWP